MFRVLVVEDDIMQASLLKVLIKKTIRNAVTDIADSYDKACKLLEAKQYGMFFLDILLCGEKLGNNGIKLAQRIRNTAGYISTPIVFVTIKPEDVMQAINKIHCHSYIVKPFHHSEIAAAIYSALSLPSYTPDPIQIRDKQGVLHPIDLNDVLYISVRNHDTSFVTEKKTYVAHNTPLSGLTEKLGPNFVRCHQSFIVNLRKVKSYDRRNCIVTVGKDLLEVGCNYRPEFEKTSFHFWETK